MPNSDKFFVELPLSLIEEADHLAKIENLNRSEFLAKVIRAYIQEQCFGEKLSKMKEGYEEMANINAALAELGMSLDLFLLEDYENNISESD